jgi:CBS domain-containing protein
MPVRVRDVLHTKLITVTPDTGVAQAVKLMVKHDVSGLPVVDAVGMLVGILTERDCINVALSSGYFDELGGLVADYMSSPVHTAKPDDNLVDVAQRLCTLPYRRFPVVDDGKLVGIVSRRDVLSILQRGSWFKERSTPKR